MDESQGMQGGDGSVNILAGTTDRAARIKRAVFRATHRGTKEMDWLLGKFAVAQCAAMDDATLVAFENMLAVEDPILYAWLLDPAKTGAPEHLDTIHAVRAFHDLTGAINTPASPWR
ncbi:MAG: succinate dehydrogenase assembly factor 2 [Pseudomonadota bacterium]